MANYTKQLYMYCLPLRHKYRTSKLVSLRSKYRSPFEIIALMLEAVRDNGETRFSLMQHTSINSSQLKRYLGSLVEIGFIETYARDGRISYKASEKGTAFLRQYDALLAMLR